MSDLKKPNNPAEVKIKRAFQNTEKEKCAAKLKIANKEIIFQSLENEICATELSVANKELAFQDAEKEKRAAELMIANKEIVFQNTQKARRAAALIVANKELVFQDVEKEKRAAELVIANKEIVFQNTQKAQRAAELVIANRELAYQDEEKEKRAAELIIANKELIFQNTEKEHRAAELVIANKELAFQNQEKEKRAAELIIANKELIFQNTEKEKRAAELLVTMMELKESETRYSNLFNLSPQPRWVYDPKTFRCLQVNKAAIDYYNYSEAEFLCMNIHDLETLKKGSKKKGLGYTTRKNNGTFSGRQRHYKKSGEAVEVEIFSNPICINDKAYRSVLAIDVTEKILYEHKFTKAIIKTQEEERYEIGAELHDNVCQILASSLMSFRLLKKSLEPEAFDLFNRSQDYILLASEEIRNLSHRLAPVFFAESTMEEAFQRLLNEFNAENKFDLSLYFDKAITTDVIGMDLQLNLYRILQQQLSNILKYAQATQIKVNLLIHKQTLKMQISDNGIGFNAGKVKEGIGIANMKRRTELFFGKMAIHSSKNNGCEIMVEIPLQENAAA